ncbi:pre-mRNA-splicing factor 18 [Condylostylus longicornis]|uniref:pre-mRNA-splicing factor 18 n=1 Tax=Condylostylus longicornis TaxID=2530218 RepID=UPI00244DF347|nr:pre-mRNA-splicing factor 18 [Condylostylus longicornis]
MDIIKAEIERKRKILLEKGLVDKKKRYFKGSDLNDKTSETTTNGVPNNEANATHLDLKSEGQTKILIDGHLILPRHEVIRRLRERGEPILLFGESDVESFKRLRQSEISQPESNRGFRNDFQEAMDAVDQAYLKEILETVSPTKSEKKDEESQLDASINWETIKEMAKGMGRGNKEKDLHIIETLLQFLLKNWSDQINSYSAQEKMTTKVKMARVIYTQTKEYLKPLFRKLKHKTLPEDILDSLRDIVKHLLNRNYIAASDAYLEMAIGNAPWPIGVTMVGIHARTGREKIFAKNVAHVMNDETQRKYIQGLKRLMTKCQEYFPTDPSRCVEYVSKKDQPQNM